MVILWMLIKQLIKSNELVIIISLKQLIYNNFVQPVQTQKLVFFTL